MRFLKFLLWVFLHLLLTALIILAVSALPDQESGGSLFMAAFFRITLSGTGAGLAFLTMSLFASLRRRDLRKQGSTPLSAGDWMNSLGFGLLPGIAVWKMFEQYTARAKGVPVFEPLPELPVLTEGGCFASARIDLVFALLCFLAIVLWLMLRKEEISGNGDLLLTVLCVWGLVRALTEGYRAEPLFTAGIVNLAQIVLLVLADIPLAVWTVRTGAKEKSAAFAALEWFSVLSAETVMSLITSAVLSTGSAIGDLALRVGCVALSMVVILLAGADSRKR